MQENKKTSVSVTVLRYKAENSRLSGLEMVCDVIRLVDTRYLSFDAIRLSCAAGAARTQVTTVKCCSQHSQRSKTSNSCRLAIHVNWLIILN